jgi:tRNA(Met) C34 N-acetyltransferase TmcA
MRFRTAIAEAKHRHNFPALCRPKKAKKKAEKITVWIDEAASIPEEAINSLKKPTK